MKILTDFDIGEEVYLKTDSEQKKRLVVAIEIRQNGQLFGITSGTETSWHYDFELSRTKDIMMTTTN